MSNETVPARLGVVLTGGTIGSSLVDIGPEEVVSLDPRVPVDESPESKVLLEALPKSLDVRLRLRRRVHKLSENIVPKDWPEVAGAVRELITDEDVSGVLVLHGTDTMSYTAAALSFLLTDLNVPVVLTGANRPPADPRSDAAKNIHDSFLSLNYFDRGTYVVFAGSPALTGWVHLGTCVRKVRAAGSAFASVNRRPVAEIKGDSFHLLASDRQSRNAARSVQTRRRDPAVTTVLRNAKATFDDRVLFFRLYPGIDLEGIYAAVSLHRMRGVVIELYPAGTGPNEPGFALPRFVERCVQDGMSVVTTVAQEPWGKTSPYESTIEVEGVGGLFLPHILPETATVKLMWALAQTGEAEKVDALMATPLAGEFG
jgi:L-asparaginase/Glu-tRNA(Gln) amidotransferase subunit D